MGVINEIILINTNNTTQLFSLSHPEREWGGGEDSVWEIQMGLSFQQPLYKDQPWEKSDNLAD